jgi:lysophospholipase L1-like esterase
MALIAFGLIAGLLLAELMLTLFYPNQERFYVWVPKLHHVFSPDSNILPGVKGPSHFTINRHGLRGDVFEPHTVNVVSIGGSTSECLYLDDAETWQYHLAEKTGWKVGSIGKSGASLFENYLHLKYAVAQLRYVDAVILMSGLNDMYSALANPHHADTLVYFGEPHSDALLSKVFIRKKRNQQKQWWKNSAVYHLVRDYIYRRKSIAWTSIQDDKARQFITLRNKRNSTPCKDTLPDLKKSLLTFSQLLKYFYKECQRQEIQLIITTQATMYNDSMSHFEKSLLWMGGVGNFISQQPPYYYCASSLKRANEMYNFAIKEFALKNPEVILIDLAAQLPKDTTIFYDDCHFNENGAQAVAEIIFRELKRQNDIHTSKKMRKVKFGLL